MSYMFAASLRTIPLLCVQWKTPDDGQKNCSKYVELCSKNKFEKLVHLVGFIIRIYHDARSPERQFITTHGHLNVNLSRRTVTWTSIYHDARSPERQFITMHGHLNVNLSRCTVTWTSIYQDARSPERVLRKMSVILPTPVAVRSERRFAAFRLLRLRVWIPPMTWIFVSCVYRVLCTGSSFSDELITHSGGPTWCVCLTVCDIGTSRMRRLDARFGLLCHIKKLFSFLYNKKILVRYKEIVKLPNSRFHETPFGRCPFIWLTLWRRIFFLF
jgi:hypothetical protein